MALRARELGKIVRTSSHVRVNRRRRRRGRWGGNGDRPCMTCRVADRPTGKSGDKREEKRDQHDRGLGRRRRDVTLASQLRSDRDRDGWHHHDYSTAQPGVFRTNYGVGFRT